MTPNENFICFKCKHLDLFSSGCAAFDNIPVKLIVEKGHSDVLPGQNAPVVFEEEEPKNE